MKDISSLSLSLFPRGGAPHGPPLSEKMEKEIGLSIVQRGSQIIIRCKNTCAPDVEFHDGVPVSSSGRCVGVSSIKKVVSDYHGETDFSMEDGMFDVRILMQVPSGV